MTKQLARPVEVTAHAVERQRQRARDGQHDIAIRFEIRQAVYAAIAAGRVRNHKIKGFGLYGAKRKQLPPSQRFVFTEDETRGWIIVREADVDVVITSLSRTGAA